MATSESDQLLEPKHSVYTDNTPSEVLNAEKIAKKSLEQNYLAIKFRFYEFVFPYDEGVKIIEAFNLAEAVTDISYDYQKIEPISTDYTLQSRVISREEYIDMKMRHILKLTEKPVPF